MYQRIVVATDGTPRGDRAVPWASMLGRRAGACELLTVTSEWRPADVARRELERTAARNGWPPAACAVLAGGDVAETLVAHVGTRQRSLMVMASHGAHPLNGPTRANVTRRVLAHTTVPVLVVGPHVEPLISDDPPALIVCVDGPEPIAPTIDAIERFVHSFSIATTWAIEVVPTSIDIAGRGHSDVHHWRRALEASGVPTAAEVLHGGDPVAGLDEFTEELSNVVYVATTCRYGDGRRHLHSTTRELIRHSRHPVLVVSGDREVADLTQGDPVGAFHPLHSWPQRKTVEA